MYFFEKPVIFYDLSSTLNAECTISTRVFTLICGRLYTGRNKEYTDWAAAANSGQRLFSNTEPDPETDPAAERVPDLPPSAMKPLHFPFSHTEAPTGAGRVPSLRRHWYRTIRGEIVLISVLFTAVLAMAIAFFSYTSFMRTLRASEQSSAESNLQVVGAELELSLDRVMSFANWATIDSSMSNYLTHMQKVDGALSRSDRLIAFNAYEIFNDEFISTARGYYVNRAVLMTADGTHYLQCLRSVAPSSVIDVRTQILEAAWFDGLASASSYQWHLEAGPISGSNAFLPVVRTIQQPTNANTAGYIFLEVSPDILTDALSGIRLEEDAALYLTMNEETYEYRAGQLVPAALPEEAITYSLNRTDIRLSLVPSSALFRVQQLYYVRLTILIFLLILFAGVLLSLALRRLISRPVGQLVRAARRIGSGDFAPDPSIVWNNELGDIGRSINDLASNVSSLMARRIQDERQRQELEYQILQSQINPHFLYNTLNTIKWMATIQGSDGIAEMSTALSRLLRNAAKGTQNLITLSDELCLVNDYLTIMKYRYGGTVDMEIRVDDDRLRECLVNRFSLQPIVENAIFHGIEPKGTAGTILLHVGQYNDPADGRELLQIDITDNGIGMDADMQERVLRQTDGAPTDFFRHIGISNVHQRIKHYFGASYGITIHSEVGQYTTVTITIPCCTDIARLSEGRKGASV